MGNTFKTAQLVIDKLAMELYNEMRLAKLVRRYSPQDYFMKGIAAPGPTIDVPMPIRYLAAAGPAINRQNIAETTKPVTLDQDFNIALDMEVFDASVNTKEQITAMSSKYLKPAARALADTVDDYLAGLALKLHNTAGAAGTTPGTGTAAATQLIFAAAEAHMARAGVSEGERRFCVLDPAAAGSVPVALSGLFVREAQEAVTKGKLGHVVGFDLYRSNNMRYHTAGTIGAGAVTNGVDQTGETININGLDGGDSLLEGDIITFGALATGPCAVNVQNKRAFQALQQFRVIATATEAGGAMAVRVWPNVITSGAYQTVSKAVTNGLAVTKVASHQTNMALVEDTLCLATCKLKAPASAVIGVTSTYEGLSLLLTAAYDVESRMETARVDIVFGGREMYPETGVRILG